MKPTWTLRRHAIAWVTLSAFACLYLWSLFYYPGADITFDNPGQIGDETVTSPSGDGTMREDMSSGREVATFRAEIAMLRRRVEDLIHREKALKERVDIIESAFGPDTSALPPSADKTRMTASLGKKKKFAAPAPKVTVTYSPLPDDGFGDILVTGSPVPVAGLRLPTQTRFGVELARAVSKAGLKKEWAALSSRHEELLGKLEVRRQTTKQGSARGPQEMKLIAGPFANAAAAARLCARLQAEGAFCKETVFTGDTF